MGLEFFLENIHEIAPLLNSLYADVLAKGPQPPSHPPQHPSPLCHPRSRFLSLPLCGACPVVGYCGFLNKTTYAKKKTGYLVDQITWSRPKMDQIAWSRPVGRRRRVGVQAWLSGPLVCPPPRTAAKDAATATTAWRRRRTGPGSWRASWWKTRCHSDARRLSSLCRQRCSRCRFDPLRPLRVLCEPLGERDHSRQWLQLEAGVVDLSVLHAQVAGKAGHLSPLLASASSPPQQVPFLLGSPVQDLLLLPYLQASAIHVLKALQLRSLEGEAIPPWRDGLSRTAEHAGPSAAERAGPRCTTARASNRGCNHTWDPATTDFREFGGINRGGNAKKGINSESDTRTL